ncbi:DNA-deoxyinosine glycosylase [Adlercreutzia mucosicola]|uniref:DNA-deoxyinosine glycosylase n=1 Tax=Adlercreutzia mucosicola TaxID=580026 RepID=UPI002B247109|nr:DNA-deoxyinosine glycosylase [Adlercreutzia mucosicola]MEB1813263.1 DNA-deoxyinosine glycosylase [Adlercreutzia mucosicola]
MGERAREREHIEHGIAPVFDGRSEVLVLGTMPSPASREAAFFYGHPQNRFWRVLTALFDEPAPVTNGERTDLLLRHHIALWDVLASCDIRGASDASIANARPNDLGRILSAAPIRRVFCTGATSARLYGKLCEPATGLAAVKLPSTSPANAAWSLPRLVEAYRPLAAELAPFEPPVLDVPAVVDLEAAIAAAGTGLDELMERAGRFLAYEVRKVLEEQAADGAETVAVRLADDLQTGPRRSPAGVPTVIFCGNGNNGGDGWVAARYLDAWGFPVCLITATDASDLVAEPARTAALRAQASLGPASRVLLSPSDAEVAAALRGAPVAVDALLGTGFAHRAVRAPFDRWIAAINEARRQGVFVLAADVPSGLSAQTGESAATTVQADATLTMIVPKPGLFAPAGAAVCGFVRTAPLAYIEPFLKGARTHL